MTRLMYASTSNFQIIQGTFYLVPTFFGDMRINLGRFAAFVAQQVLNIAQIHPFFQADRSGRVVDQRKQEAHAEVNIRCRSAAIAAARSRAIRRAAGSARSLCTFGSATAASGTRTQRKSKPALPQKNSKFFFIPWQRSPISHRFYLEFHPKQVGQGKKKWKRLPHDV